MTCERTRRIRGWLAGLVAATVLLSFPASGLAADRSPAGDELAAIGTLARGAGYGTHAGSEPVRLLQLHLRRLGDRPGPVDGLYGPRTEAAVERFQQAHGLATDGVVGSQTKTRLLAQRAERPAADTSRPTQPGKPERKSPAGSNAAESATGQNPARGAPSEALTRAGPRPVQEVPPELLMVLIVLAVGSLLIALRAYGRRTREAWVNFGMVCAALLAMFVIGAATGAVFATQAAPDDGGETTADSGALFAGRDAATPRAAGDRPTLARLGEPPGARSAAKRRDAATRRRAARAAASKARADARNARIAASRARGTTAPARVPAPPAPAAEPLYAPVPNRPTVYAPPAPPRSTSPVQRPAPTAGPAATYTVQPGDALWPIAERHLAPTSSVAQVARRVEVLETLNAGRIASGDPDVLEAGEELRLR